MDNIFFLVKQAVEALLDFQKFFDNKDLFGSMRGVILSDHEQELDDFFVKLIQKVMMSFWGKHVSIFHFFKLV